MDAGEGDSDAIPFSRPHPRSKPQTVVENLHRNWNIERGHVKRSWVRKVLTSVFRLKAQTGAGHSGYVSCEEKKERMTRSFSRGVRAG